MAVLRQLTVAAAEEVMWQYHYCAAMTEVVLSESHSPAAYV